MQTMTEYLKELEMVVGFQQKLNTERPTAGVRMTLPLVGREIEICAYYCEKENYPTIFSYFGGGFVMGGHVLDERLWNVLRDLMSCNIISINYRKAPQHRFPCSLNDAYEALSYCLSHREIFRIGDGPIGVFGSSAGGNLAIATAFMDIKNDSRLIDFVIANYPYLDLATKPQEKGHPEFEWNMYQYFPEAYNEGKDLKNPMISPFFADDALLRRLPPLLIASGTKDALKTEDIAFYERALHCGCKAALYIAEGMPHGYVEAYYQICEAREAGIEDHFPSDLGFDQMLKDGSLRQQTESTLTFYKSKLDNLFS